MNEISDPPAAPPKKERMPTGMYVGSALLGLSILGLLFFIYAFIQTNALIRAGVGDVANFMTILILIAIFLVGLPGYLGLRLLRRSRRAAQVRKEPKA
ncbi:MAG: hypothetical protein M5U01_28330 [Ardenticatenaceae bacterium]|nr:hypothetical protein [Ardenticatenaceae bacterium]HBY92608.1 hypothetical protein [Chloroflexota bacterium]